MPMSVRQRVKVKQHCSPPLEHKHGEACFGDLETVITGIYPTVKLGGVICGNCADGTNPLISRQQSGTLTGDFAVNPSVLGHFCYHSR